MRPFFRAFRMYWDMNRQFEDDDQAMNSVEALARSAGVSPPVCGTGTETVPEPAAGTVALRLRTVHRKSQRTRIAHSIHKPMLSRTRRIGRFMQSTLNAAAPLAADIEHDNRKRSMLKHGHQTRGLWTPDWVIIFGHETKSVRRCRR